MYYKKFKDRYLAVELEFEEIYRYTWYLKKHDEIEVTLGKFLGLNEEEEDVWIEVSDEALKEMLDAQKWGSKK